MRVLALRGAHVVGTARTLERGCEACAATPVVLELSDFESLAGVSGLYVGDCESGGPELAPAGFRARGAAVGASEELTRQYLA
jgi:hypothetical protein